MKVQEDIKKFKDYLAACGEKSKLEELGKVEIDENTFLVSSVATKLEEIKKDVDYYINIKHLTRYRKKKHAEHDIYESEQGVCVVKDNKLLAIVPIYESGNVYCRGNILSVTGHEETATVDLNNLSNSFVYRTR